MNGGGQKYTHVEEAKCIYPMSEDNKFSSPVICHQMNADDQSIMKSSPNSQLPLTQLTTANLHMEMDGDGCVVKNEENYVLQPYLH